MRDIAYSNALNQLFVSDFDGNRLLAFNKTATGFRQTTQSLRIFALLQNYPNPFNPSTKIRYTLPFDSRVKLGVFNVVGERVAELVNDKVMGGAQEVTWYTNAPSGIYFYRLEAVAIDHPDQRFMETKKMTVIH